MFTFPLPLQGPVDVAIETLRADPLLVLKKFPLVRAITQVVPGEYLIETYPLALTNRLQVPKFIVVSVAANATHIVLNPPADKSVYTHIDGWVEGAILPLNETMCKMEIAIKLQTAIPFAMADLAMKNAMTTMSADLANRFRANMVDASFSNTLPA